MKVLPAKNVENIIQKLKKHAGITVVFAFFHCMLTKMFQVIAKAHATV